MKKIVSLILALAMCVGVCLSMSACSGEEKADFTVGICQLMEHESLDKAT